MTVPIQPQPVSGSFTPERTPYDALGGESAVREMIEAFYDHMDRDPMFVAVRALHPPDLTGSRQKLFEFISGWLGGPPLYIEKHGHPRLRARHLPFAIDQTARDQWMACMKKAMDERLVTGEVRAFLDARFAQLADFMRNR